MSTEEKFAELIAGVLAFHRQDCSKFVISVWKQACDGYTYDQVNDAMARHHKDPERGVFAPKPADIIRIIDGTKQDRANLAWGKVVQAISSVGYKSDVVFDDAVIHAVVFDLGGWVKFCGTKTDNLGYLQAAFVKAYQAYADKPHFDYPKMLQGDNGAADDYLKIGLRPPKPAVVGDRAKAIAVYKGGGAGVAQIAPSIAPRLKAPESE